MSTEPKSSFIKRTLSKECVISQMFRPQLANRVANSLDIFERIVSEAETLTKLGTVMAVSQVVYHITSEDLKTNLEDFNELEQIAVQGRAFLNSIGYVPQRRGMPILGKAPVGKTVEVQPITTQLPGSEPLEGVIVSPKAK